MAKVERATAICDFDTDTELEITTEDEKSDMEMKNEVTVRNVSYAIEKRIYLHGIFM